jgi:hypothetical protein
MIPAMRDCRCRDPVRNINMIECLFDPTAIVPRRDPAVCGRDLICPLSGQDEKFGI